MKRPLGALVARDTADPQVRYLRFAAFPALLVGEGLVTYLIVRAVADFARVGFDARHVAGFILLPPAAVLGLIVLILTVRVGPNAVYEDGIDMRNSVTLLGPTFFTWDEFLGARIETVGRPPRSVTRIVLERRTGRRWFTLSSAYADPEFVDALERFLETSGALHIERGEPEPTA